MKKRKKKREKVRISLFLIRCLSVWREHKLRNVVSQISDRLYTRDRMQEVRAGRIFMLKTVPEENTVFGFIEVN